MVAAIRVEIVRVDTNKEEDIKGEIIMIKEDTLQEPQGMISLAVVMGTTGVIIRVISKGDTGQELMVILHLQAQNLKECVKTILVNLKHLQEPTIAIQRKAITMLRSPSDREKTHQNRNISQMNDVESLSVGK